MLHALEYIKNIASRPTVLPFFSSLQSRLANTNYYTVLYKHTNVFLAPMFLYHCMVVFNLYLLFRQTTINRLLSPISLILTSSTHMIFNGVMLELVDLLLLVSLLEEISLIIIHYLGHHILVVL